MTTELAEHTINVPLARKVLEFLEDHREHHRQSEWAGVSAGALRALGAEDTADLTVDQVEELSLGACGTVGCFAGWTAVMDGHTVGTIGDLAGVVIDLSPGLLLRDTEWGVEIVNDDHERVTAEGYARKALGLTPGRAIALFHGGRTRTELRGMLSKWTNGEIEAVRPE